MSISLKLWQIFSPFLYYTVVNWMLSSIKLPRLSLRLDSRRVVEKENKFYTDVKYKYCIDSECWIFIVRVSFLSAGNETI